MNFNNFENIVKVITGLIAIIGIIIGAYIGYSDIVKKINTNGIQIEKTQMMILRKTVREYECNKCSVSDEEWDNYIESYSLLFELKQKHKFISHKTPWKPIERLNEKTEDILCKE